MTQGIQQCGHKTPSRTMPRDPDERVSPDQPSMSADLNDPKLRSRSSPARERRPKRNQEDLSAISARRVERDSTTQRKSEKSSNQSIQRKPPLPFEVRGRQPAKPAKFVSSSTGKSVIIPNLPETNVLELKSAGIRAISAMTKAQKSQRDFAFPYDPTEVPEPTFDPSPLSRPRQSIGSKSEYASPGEIDSRVDLGESFKGELQDDVDSSSRDPQETLESTYPRGLSDPAGNGNADAGLEPTSKSSSPETGSFEHIPDEGSLLTYRQEVAYLNKRIEDLEELLRGTQQDLSAQRTRNTDLARESAQMRRDALFHGPTGEALDQIRELQEESKASAARTAEALKAAAEFRTTEARAKYDIQELELELTAESRACSVQGDRASLAISQQRNAERSLADVSAELIKERTALRTEVRDAEANARERISIMELEKARLILNESDTESQLQDMRTQCEELNRMVDSFRLSEAKAYAQLAEAGNAVQVSAGPDHVGALQQTNSSLKAANESLAARNQEMWNAMAKLESQHEASQAELSEQCRLQAEQLAAMSSQYDADDQDQYPDEVWIANPTLGTLFEGTDEEIEWEEQEPADAEPQLMDTEDEPTTEFVLLAFSRCPKELDDVLDHHPALDEIRSVMTEANIDVLLPGFTNPRRARRFIRPESHQRLVNVLWRLELNLRNSHVICEPQFEVTVRLAVESIPRKHSVNIKSRIVLQVQPGEDDLPRDEALAPEARNPAPEATEAIGTPYVAIHTPEGSGDGGQHASIGYPQPPVYCGVEIPYVGPLHPPVYTASSELATLPPTATHGLPIPPPESAYGIGAYGEVMLTTLQGLLEAQRTTTRIQEAQEERIAEAARLKALEPPKRIQLPRDVKQPGFQGLPAYEDPKKGSLSSVYYFREIWGNKAKQNAARAFIADGEQWGNEVFAKVVARWHKYVRANNLYHEDLETKRGQTMDSLSQLPGGGWFATQAVMHEERAARTHLAKDKYYPSKDMEVYNSQLATTTTDSGVSFNKVGVELTEVIVGLRMVENGARDKFLPWFTKVYHEDLPDLKAIFGEPYPEGTMADMLFHVLTKACPGGHDIASKWPKQLGTLEQWQGESTAEFLIRWEISCGWIDDFGYIKQEVTPSVNLLLAAMSHPVNSMAADRRTLWNDTVVVGLGVKKWNGSSVDDWDKVFNLLKKSKDFISDYGVNVVPKSSAPKAAQEAKASAKALQGNANPASKGPGKASAKPGPGGGKGGGQGGKNSDAEPKGKGGKGGKGAGKGKKGKGPNFVLAKWIPTSSPPPKLADDRSLRPPRKGTPVRGGQRELDLIMDIPVCFGWHGKGRKGATAEKFCQYGAACAYRHTAAGPGHCHVCNRHGHTEDKCDRPGGGAFEGPEFPPEGMPACLPVNAMAQQGEVTPAAPAEAQANAETPKAKAAAAKAAASKAKAPSAKAKAAQAKAEERRYASRIVDMDDATFATIASQRGYSATRSAYDAWHPTLDATAPPSAMIGHGIPAGYLPPTAAVLRPGGSMPLAQLGANMPTLVRQDVPSPPSQDDTRSQASASTVVYVTEKASPSRKEKVDTVMKALQAGPKAEPKKGMIATVAVALNAGGDNDDQIPEGSWAFDSAANEVFRNKREQEDTRSLQRIEMAGANNQTSMVEVDAHRDLIVEGEQLLPATRLARKGVTSGIFLQGYQRPWVDHLSQEDVDEIVRILERSSYRRAMIRNNLPYVTPEHGMHLIEALHRAEGRMAVAVQRNPGK